VVEAVPDPAVVDVVVGGPPLVTVVGVVGTLGVTTVVGVPVVLDVVEELVVEVSVDADVVDVVVGAIPVSGDVQFTGGLDVLGVPGINRVPAHPKLENWPSRVTLPPSENETVDDDSRMNPDASMEIRSRMPV
jgi:xanthosine utilization system XapX-like protein